MEEPLLEVAGLTVVAESQGRHRDLLTDISFTLRAKSVLGIIGESGSGKTVLSRALIRWLSPPLRITGGRVMFAGRDILQAPAHEIAAIRGCELGYIGSNPTGTFDPTLPVGSQIVEKLRAVRPGISHAQARQRVIATLDAVRIPNPRKRFEEFPFQFSGGMMQRAAIVDALVAGPRLLVADNITQSLDVTVAAQILRLLRDLEREFDTAIVFISSSLGVVNDIADDVLVLNRGQVVEHQPARQLITSPRHAYTCELLAKVPRVWGAEVRQPVAAISQDVVLEVHDVHKTYKVRDRSSVFVYRGVQAVRGVTFSVRRGENFGIIGESGCGKSTLSRLLSHLERPDRGTIRYEGEDVSHLGGKRLLALRRRFQLLLQDPYNAVPPHFSIGHSIGEPLRIHGLASGRALREKVIEVMHEVGLAQSLYHELPVGLSAGQRQRVNIARAMVLDPDMLILDETLSALDQVEQAKLLGLFESIQTRHQMTYIYISHDLAMVRRVCGRIAVMYLGRIVEDATNQTVFCNSGHPYTRALLSAVPTVEHRPFASETYLLEGEPPDPVNIPPGCSFRTRCPFAFDACATTDPALYARGEGEQSACHLMRDAGPQHPLFPIDPMPSLQSSAFGRAPGEAGILADGPAGHDARAKQGEAR